ncbi:hypothetical protein [Nostoc sp.]
MPKQPQVEREIKRLLKVLNNPIFLFPVVRSVVAGRYEDNGLEFRLNHEKRPSTAELITD